MGAALDVNWETVKMLAIQIGVREAARRMGISEDAVMQRSAREGWLRDLPRSQQLPPSVRQAVSGVSAAPQAAVNYLKDVLLVTRTNHAKIAQIASAEMLTTAEKTPSILLIPEMAGVVLTHGKHAALAGGWAEHAASPKVTLGAVSSEPLTMEAEILEEASTDVADY